VNDRAGRTYQWTIEVIDAQSDAAHIPNDSFYSWYTLVAP
jgi:hypothetical protein